MEYNLADIFESIVDTIGDNEALACGEDRLTFRQLEDGANRFAHYLQSIGIQPGEHVGIQLYNGVEYLTAMIGCFKVRAVPINVNYRYVEEELAYLYNDADLVAVVYDVEFAQRVRAVRDHAAKLRQLVVVGGSDGDAKEWDQALASGSADRSGFPQRSPHDLYIIYTGGTTGMPKGVMWRHEDLFFAGMGGADPTGTPVARPEEVAERLAKTGGLGMVMFPVAPLMHGAAQLASWIAFLQGNRVVLIRKFDGDEVVRTIEREKVNIMNIVGDAMARPMAEALARRPNADVSSLFVLSSAGALLSSPVREQLKRHLPNLAILDNFGASETGFNGTGVDDGGQGLRVTLNERTAVLGDDLQPIEPGSGQVGRVAQRRHVPVGYYNDPVKSAETFVEIDGERWVLLGDMATIEADGTVTVLGRGTLCINTGGEKVYPEEVEAALKSHPAVFDAVVTGVPHPSYGQQVAGIVQLRESMQADEDELRAHCRTKVAGYKVPRVLVFVDAIQRSPSGKADYPWAKRVAEGVGV